MLTPRVTPNASLRTGTVTAMAGDYKHAYQPTIPENFSPVEPPTGVGAAEHNISKPEAFVSMALGVLGLAYAAKSRDTLGVVAGTIGGLLAWRGATQHCAVYEALGVHTNNEPLREHSLGLTRPGSGTTSRPGRGHSAHVTKSLHINRSAEELYTFWRRLSNLAHIMPHLESVTETSERRSIWVAKAPAGTTVQWDAEITIDKPNQELAWRSADGSTVASEGRITFKRHPSGRGTLLTVEMNYTPPAGTLGVAVARLFGRDADAEMQYDLHRFKQLMETGEVPTLHGQPKG